MIILSRSIVKGDTFDNGYDVVSDRVSQSASGYLTRGSHRQENDRVGSPFFRDPRFTPTEEWIGGHDLAGELSRGRSTFELQLLLQRPVEPPSQDFVEACHQIIGFTMMIPSTVGVPPATSSIVSLRRSPAAAIHVSAGVLSSDGVTPAVPPP